MSLKLIFILIILSILSLILFFILSSILRRVSHSKKYKELDRQRELYREKLLNALQGKVFQQITDFHTSPKSIKWQAIEDILLDLITEVKYKEDVKALFNRLGYIPFYEKKIRGKKVLTRASAIDKLGKMLSESSTEKIIEILGNEKSVEVISVAIRALSRISSTEGLKGILERLPDLLRKSLVSRKTIKASLVNFGIAAVPILIEYGEKYDDPNIRASILEVLSDLPATELGCSFALENLKNENAEVRAKALKILGRADTASMRVDPGLLIPLFDDNVWYVRLQAAKASGNLKYEKAVDILGGLLLDENWHVRNAAATALTKFEDAAICIFLRALKYKDLYAKESICEEIEKTNFIYRLIENLGSNDREIYEKSKEILNIMHSLNFSTPLVEYMRKEGNDKMKKEIYLILNKEAKI